MYPIETIAIGDELLTGAITDTNSAFIGSQLVSLGHRLNQETAIADNEEKIIQTLLERSPHAKLIFVFGGLGPTSDDRTVEAVCRMLSCPAVSHEPSRLKIEELYQKRQQPLTSYALKQALYPRDSDPFPNSVGLAPGFRIELKECQCFFLPGVPLEMKSIFSENILPWLRQNENFRASAKLKTKVWRCIGIFESQLQKQMDPIEAFLNQDAWLGYRTHFPENHLTLYYRGEDQKLFEAMESKIDSLLKPWCYTRTDPSMEWAVFNALKTKGAKVAFAESCTAGLAANRLSRIPGASDVLFGGVVVYRLEAKHQILGITFDTPDLAISVNSSRLLAKKIQEISKADLGAAITGYLGPEATREKPAGTIFCCVVDKWGNTFEKQLLINATDRERTQWGAATHLLNLVRSVAV